jgi:hypothetical protein
MYFGVIYVIRWAPMTRYFWIFCVTLGSYWHLDPNCASHKFSLSIRIVWLKQSPFDELATTFCSRKVQRSPFSSCVLWAKMRSSTTPRCFQSTVKTCTVYLSPLQNFSPRDCIHGALHNNFVSRLNSNTSLVWQHSPPSELHRPEESYLDAAELFAEVLPAWVT